MCLSSFSFVSDDNGATWDTQFLPNEFNTSGDTVTNIDSTGAFNVQILATADSTSADFAVADDAGSEVHFICVVEE